MKFNLIHEKKRISVIGAILLIVVGTFIGVISYKANDSQRAFSQIEQTKAKAEQEAKAKAEQEVKAKASVNDTVSVTSVKTEEKKGFNNPIFANSSQVFLVTTNGTSTSYGIGSMYEKTNGEWNKLIQFTVRLGSNGISYTRVQNSNKTPAGVLNILSAFGVADNPGAHYLYHKVTEEDYWDLNSGSPTYNRMIGKNPGGDFEHLIDHPIQYKYALVTDWNCNQVPDKGGAIFIHVNGTGATGSCISMSEKDMINLIRWINPSNNPKILVVPNSDLSKYFY